MRVWRNRNGYTAVLLHHTADPDTASLEERRLSVPDEERYRREHELDFSSWAGKKVYPGFNDSHIDENIGPLPDLPLWVGMDFGYHHPAAIFAQIGYHDQGGALVWVLGEVMGEDMTLDQFLARVFLPYKNKHFPRDGKWLYAADPAGRQVSDKSEHTSFAILSNHGIFPMQRKSEINEGLTIIRQRIDLGLLKVHPRCRLLIEALKGGYRYPEPTPGRPEPLLPAKDGYFEHVADAFRYLCINAISLIAPRPKPESKPETWVDRAMGRKRQQSELALLSD